MDPRVILKKEYNELRDKCRKLQPLVCINLDFDPDLCKHQLLKLLDDAVICTIAIVCGDDEIKFWNDCSLKVDGLLQDNLSTVTSSDIKNIYPSTYTLHEEDYNDFRYNFGTKNHYEFNRLLADLTNYENSIASFKKNIAEYTTLMSRLMNMKTELANK